MEAKLADYDLNQDTPYGLASADMPISGYDRPELAMANLLRFDVDGLTRAMLSPDTLSPKQMQTVTQMFTKGKKPGPIVKTILDIATNPFVIMGLLLHVKFPISSTKPMLDIYKGLLPKSAAMGKWASYLHGAMENLRTIPGMFENLKGTFLGIEKYTQEWGSKFQKVFTNAGPLTEAERLAVAARLDGLHKAEHYMVKAFENEPEYIAFFKKKGVPIAAGLQAKMSPRLLSVTDKMRSAFDDIWAAITGDKDAFERIAHGLQMKGYKVGGAVEDFWPRSADWDKYYKQAIRGDTRLYRKYVRKGIMSKVGPHEIAREGGLLPNLKQAAKLEKAGYIPAGFEEQVTNRILQRWTNEAAAVAENIWKDVSTLGLSTADEQIKFAERMMEYYTKGAGKNVNLVARLGSTNKAKDTLTAMARALQDSRGAAPGAFQAELQEIGKVLGVPGQYSLEPVEVIEKYVNSVSRDYAYHGLGHAAKIDRILKTPGVFEGAPYLEELILDNYLPGIVGFKSWPQMKRSMNGLIMKEKILGWVKNHPMVEKTLGKANKQLIIDKLEKSRNLSSDAIGAQVASWFHLSTLGLNLSATSANSMQTFLTTLNRVGARGIWRGLHGTAGEEGLLQRVPKFFDALKKTGSTNQAFNIAFPEFVAEQGEWAKTTRRLLEGDIAASGFPKLFKAKGVWEKIKGAIMLPFSGTEAGNQLLAFYSGRNQHIFENAAKMASAGERAKVLAEAGKHGSALALNTQFAGGPLGIPRAIMNINPMWRQYMHFPMRLLSFMHGSLRMGEDPTKWDWGTIGRMLAGSTAMYVAGRNLAGMDLGRGLLLGALPIPGYEHAPFYPWPLVPPVASVVGGLGKALLTSDPHQLGSLASMLVPGGIAARRAFKSLAPRYADYANPTPDGRIPLYNDDKALIGSLSPMELTLRAIGLRPKTISAEAGAAKWILSQRDRVRKYRRDYTMALFENETQRAEDINKEFQRVYPELGPLQIKKSDLTALRNRREMSRLQRIERAIPHAYRPIFQQILADASLSQMTEGVQMENLGGLESFSGLL